MQTRELLEQLGDLADECKATADHIEGYPHSRAFWTRSGSEIAFVLQGIRKHLEANGAGVEVKP